MATRNTQILTQIVEALGDLIASPADALVRLETRYHDALLINAGTTTDVAAFAEKLRLAIIDPESVQVLDLIGHSHVAGITIDHVEDAINSLFENRFIEP